MNTTNAKSSPLNEGERYCKDCNGTGIIPAGKPGMRAGRMCLECMGSGKLPLKGPGFYTPMDIAPGELNPPQPKPAAGEKHEFHYSPDRKCMECIRCFAAADSTSVNLGLPCQDRRIPAPTPAQTQAEGEECPHEAWECLGGGHRCADCREYLGEHTASNCDAPLAQVEGGEVEEILRRYADIDETELGEDKFTGHYEIGITTSEIQALLAQARAEGKVEGAREELNAAVKVIYKGPAKHLEHLSRAEMAFIIDRTTSHLEDRLATLDKGEGE